MTAELPAPPNEAVTLRTLLNALDSAVAEPVDTPAGDDIALSSVALVDAADLAMETWAHFPMQDVYLHVGVDEAEAVRWLEEAVHRPLAQRTRVLMSKLARESAAMRNAAHHAGVALVAVHPKARWDQVSRGCGTSSNDPAARERCRETPTCSPPTPIFSVSPRSSRGMPAVGVH